MAKADAKDKMGMLIDYYYCTGCHTCEVACKERFDLPNGEFGIKLSQNGPWQHGDSGLGSEDWEWNWVPIPTQYCNFCVDRIEAGKRPLCEMECQAFVITVGKLSELLPKMQEGRKMVLYNETNDGDNGKTPEF